MGGVVSFSVAVLVAATDRLDGPDEARTCMIKMTCAYGGIDRPLSGSGARRPERRPAISRTTKGSPDPE